MQADHYIIRLNETNILPKEQLINRVIEVNGYVLGSATVDFRFENSIDDAFMTALLLTHKEKTGRKIDENRSRMHNISGGAVGKLWAIFYSSQQDMPQYISTRDKQKLTPYEEKTGKLWEEAHRKSEADYYQSLMDVSDSNDKEAAINKVKKARATHPSNITEIYLGTNLNYNLFSLGIYDGGIYYEKGRLMILRKFEMVPSYSNDLACIADMSPIEFGIRSLYFSMSFLGRGDYKGKPIPIGKLDFNDFRGMESILGMADHSDNRISTYCQGKVKEWLKSPESANELEYLFPRITKRKARCVILDMIKENPQPVYAQPTSKFLIDESDEAMINRIIDVIYEIGDNGALDTLFNVMRNTSIITVRENIRRTIELIINKNLKIFKSSPDIICSKCSTKAIKKEYRLGILKRYKYIICPICNLSSYICEE